MVAAPLAECSFYIPIRRDAEISDGKPHSPKAWSWLGKALYARFSAWTLSPGLYEGVWKSPKTGQPIRDKSYRYVVALNPSRLDELRGLMVEACGVFKQKTMYLSIAGMVEFIAEVRT